MLRNLLNSWVNFQDRIQRKNTGIPSETTGELQFPTVASPPAWPPELQQFVQDRQEREYRRLAQALQLGSDPAKAYAHLSRGSVPAAYDVDRDIRLLGVDPLASWKGYAQMAGRPFDPGLGALSIEDLLTAEQLQAFKRKVSDTYTRYDSLQLPTPYEDQHRYGSMVLTFDEVQAQLSRRGQSLVQNVFLATLPSGDVNAIVAREPYTNTQIVFFEQGLFQFLRDFARLIGGITIPLTPQQLRSDAALAQLPRRYTMPVAASEYFIGMLGGYVVEGTPLANSVSLPLPTHNMFTTLLLSSLMERFVMAHELAHVMRGHLNKKQAKKQEYEADAFALALVIQSAQESPGSWAVGFWACDLVLTALHYLYKAIGLMAFGPDNLTWISQTHPDPLSRRARLRENASRVFPHVPQVGLDAAGELCGMTDGLLQGLWNMCSEIMFLSVMAGKRPSPMWNDWIKMNIKVKDYTYGDILIDILGESIGVKRHRRVKK